MFQIEDNKTWYLESLQIRSSIFSLQRSPCIEGHLPSKNVFIESCLPLKDVLHWKPSSIKGSLPSKVVFYQCLSYIYHYILSTKDIILQRLASIEGHLLISKVVSTFNVCNLLFGSCPWFPWLYRALVWLMEELLFPEAYLDLMTPTEQGPK